MPCRDCAQMRWSFGCAIWLSLGQETWFLRLPGTFWQLIGLLLKSVLFRTSIPRKHLLKPCANHRLLKVGRISTLTFAHHYSLVTVYYHQQKLYPSRRGSAHLGKFTVFSLVMSNTPWYVDYEQEFKTNECFNTCGEIQNCREYCD